MAYADLKELGTELEAGPHCLLIVRERRVSVYEEAPGFCLGPR